jgi:hypothetical protein
MAEERVAQNVVSSENASTFYAEKLGLTDGQPPEAGATPPEPALNEEELKAKEEAKAKEEPKKSEKLEKRFSKVTKQRDEANARAVAAENRLKELEAGKPPTEAPKQAKSGDKPQASQFNDYAEYAEALADWSVENALKQRDAQEAEKQAKAAQDNIQKSWADKVEQAKKGGLADFDEVVSAMNVNVDNNIIQAIMESDVGAQMVYQLAQDEDYAKEIAKMPVAKALVALGKLEAKLEAQKEKPKAKQESVARSKAPDPIKPLGGGNAKGMESMVGSDGEYRGSYAQWKADRRAGKIR